MSINMTRNSIVLISFVLWINHFFLLFQCLFSVDATWMSTLCVSFAFVCSLLTLLWFIGVKTNIVRANSIYYFFKFQFIAYLLLLLMMIDDLFIFSCSGLITNGVVLATILWLPLPGRILTCTFPGAKSRIKSTPYLCQIRYSTSL